MTMLKRFPQFHCCSDGFGARLRDAVRAAERRRLHGRRLAHHQGEGQGILNEPSLKVTQIDVETYKSVVQLSGFVDNAASQATAVEIAKAVKA